MNVLPFQNTRFWTVVLVAIVLSLTMTLPQSAQASKVASYTQDGGLIRLANAHYEVALSIRDGGFVYILDKSTGEHVSKGNRASNLWVAPLDNGQVVESSTYADHFSQTWDEVNGMLTLSYTGDLAVQVSITVSEAPTLKLQASVTNNTGATVSDFQFPGHLKFTQAEVQDALLPMMPGALIDKGFFSKGRSYISLYPGVMFADYLSLNSTQGNLTMYTQRGQVVQPTLIGFEHLGDEPDYTVLTHKYQTWILSGVTWTSPWVVINIGQDYRDTIIGYRADNGIDQYKSLETKLGNLAESYFQAPIYKMDVAALRMTFADLQTQAISALNFPGIVHLVAFQPRGHDKNYPDFIPPDTKWGTTDDLIALVNAIHENGSLAVPYTNFSWWDSNGPTLGKLPPETALNSLINIKDSHGLPGFESYGPNSGFVMNLHNAFVTDKISNQHDILINTIGVDAIFEDQWGARSTPYDFNPAGLETYDPSTAYFEGILKHYLEHADNHLMTEIGIDVLAENGIAFMGTNYLWDMLGYRSATAGVTTYYPMAGMLLRDKVLFYQHDLAAETWTKNKDMLRWNLAQGYNLSNAFLDPNGGLNMENPWLNLIGVFQKYVLANYSDELIASYETVRDRVTRTSFLSYTVYANWDTERPYLNGDFALPPGGVMTQANDGSVTAGVFTTHNGLELSEGDHYLVEVRSADGIQVFQPLGSDTDIRIVKDASWANVQIMAYQYDGTVISTVDNSIEGDWVQFRYTNLFQSEAVGYYVISSADQNV